MAGPLDLGGVSDGGVPDADLRTAALQSLQLRPELARARALDIDWNPVRRQFIDHHVPLHDTGLRGVTKLTQILHKLAP